MPHQTYPGRCACLGLNSQTADHRYRAPNRTHLECVIFVHREALGQDLCASLQGADCRPQVAVEDRQSRRALVVQDRLTIHHNPRQPRPGHDQDRLTHSHQSTSQTPLQATFRHSPNPDPCTYYRLSLLTSVQPPRCLLPRRPRPPPRTTRRLSAPPSVPSLNTHGTPTPGPNSTSTPHPGTPASDPRSP